MNNTVIIRNAQIVNEGKIISADVLIENNCIKKIAGNIGAVTAKVELDAKGNYLIPGIIDDQVHFREPGLTHKATIHSESRAGIAGGVTSFMEMPNTVPPAHTHELLEEKYKIASQTSLANYSFFLGASNDNLEEIKKTDPKKVCGVKIFMGSSTGKLVVDNPVALENIFRHSPTLIATHCEDDNIIKANAEKYKQQFGSSIPIECHPLIRNETNCFESSKRAVTLAMKHNARLHILHISTEEELALFVNDIPLKDKNVTAEACVHHLWFSADDYSSLGSLIKCNPAIKEPRHRTAIWKALLDNRIDVVATDHAPHTWEEKHTTTPDGKSDYFKIPSGLPLLQHSFHMMYQSYLNKKISLEKIVEKMCHAPADLFRINNRGYIREGYFADLFLFDPSMKWTVEKSNLYYKCGWSPMEGTSFTGKVTHTLVNGNVVYENGKFHESVMGERLFFDR